MKSDFKELVSHAKHYVTADLFSKGLSFLTIPVFTRLLMPYEYGVLAVYTSFVGLLVIIFGLGFRGAVERFYFENRANFFDFLSSNFWFLSISGIIFSLICILFKDWLLFLFNIPLGLIYIGLGVVFFSSLIEIFQSYFIAAQRSITFSKTTIIQSVLIVSLSVIIMINLESERYYGRAVAELLASILLLIFFISDFGTKNKFRIDKGEVKYSIFFGIPIVFHLLSQSILNFFDQIIINQLVGPRETGIYALAYKIGMVQSIITMGVLKAWTPMLYERMNTKNYSSIRDLASKYSWVVSLVAVLLILFSNEMIHLLADESFKEAQPIVPIIVLGYLFFFLYSMYVGFAFYNKRTQLIFLFTLAAGIINIALNYYFIPNYGYIAAAWTTALSFACLFLFHFINVKWLIKSEFVLKLSTFFFSFLMVFIVFGSLKLIASQNYLNGFILRICVSIVCITITFYCLRKQDVV